MAPSIPDRWTSYKPCGKIIEGTRIICFKVPLRKAIQLGKKEITEIWDVDTLLNAIPNLGAVIDLTNTARYYNPVVSAVEALTRVLYEDLRPPMPAPKKSIDLSIETKELRNAGVLYKKICMPGRIIPPTPKVYEFMDAVDEFMEKSYGSIIGVHCTHGLNRTGYMVCRYMRDRMGIDAKEAIRKFEIARGYKIERDNYVADLIGKIPPPPDVGNDTKIRPIEDSKEIVRDCSKENGRESPSRYSKRRRSGRSRERRMSRREENVEDNNDYAFGRYVRHPDYDFLSMEQPGDCHYQDSTSGYRSIRTETRDYDRPYDYKYDY